MDKILSEIKKRVLEYLKIKGISKESFYAKTGISASNFKGDGAKSELGGDKIVKILTEYPDLNSEWLLMGTGSMLRDELSVSSPAPVIVHERDPRDIELIATLKGMVETQKDLIIELKREKSAEGLGSGQRSAQTATYPYAGPQSALK